MGLRKAARRKGASDRETASLEKHGVYELVPRLIWGSPSICFATWPGPPTSSSLASREGLRSLPSQMLTGVVTQTTANQHRRASSCSRTAQQVFKWDFKASLSVNNGSGARRSSAINERGRLLREHDAGARIQG